MGFRSSVEDAIAFISPKTAANRARYSALNNSLRSYEAASKSRRTKSWKGATGASANGETVVSLFDLRARSRDLVRNNPYAKKAIDILTTNTISTGIHPTPGGEGVPKLAIKKAKSAWKLWADSVECDANKQMNFMGIQRLAARSMFESGEVLIRKIRRVNTPGIVPIALQVLEVDHIDANRNEMLRDGGKIIQGVEFNKQGIRVAYWLYDTHPGDMFLSSTFGSFRVSAEEIIHLYKVDRPGQVRGVPFGVASFIRMRDLDSYADAQLVRQQIAACFAIFITDSAAAEGFQAPGTRAEDALQRVEPGMIETLPAGKSIEMASPPEADGYEPYTRTVLREIACAYGTTYEALTGDFSNVNFSSARMGWLEFGRLVEELQEIVFIPQFFGIVWNWFCQGAVINGDLKTAIPCGWTSPRRQFIDPLKETKALVEMVRAGFISWQEAVRQMGYEPEEVAKQLGEDYTLFDAMGFMLSCDSRNDDTRGDQFEVPNEDKAEATPGATSKTPAKKKKVVVKKKIAKK